MKQRIILGGLAVLAILLLARCHFIMPALRRPDAVIPVKTTGYCACGKCCGWRFTWYGKPVVASGPNAGDFKGVGKTASGAFARPGTVAVDPDVFPMGTKFYIPGYGWGIARDIGGAVGGRHIDLFFWLHTSALRWGVQSKQVKVWYPEKQQGPD